jgi:hypothetical protein
MILMPSLTKTASKAWPYLLSRSRIRKRNDDRRSWRIRVNWRARWVTHSPVGLACSLRCGRVGYRVR